MFCIGMNSKLVNYYNYLNYHITPDEADDIDKFQKQKIGFRGINVNM